MNFTRLNWFEAEENGVTYVRLGAANWAQWMGESLEILQDHKECARLEGKFSAFVDMLDKMSAAPQAEAVNAGLAALLKEVLDEPPHADE